MAYQAFLSFTTSWSLLKLMSIESVMPSNHHFLCHLSYPLPLIFPSVKVFSYESVFASGCQSNGPSASASVLTMNNTSWYPLGLTALISLLSKDSQESSQHHSLKVSIWCWAFFFFFWCSAFFMVQLSHQYHNYWKNHGYRDLCWQTDWCLCFLVCSLGLW